jgi:hypothetical protein
MPGAFAGDVVEQQHTHNREVHDEEDEGESEEDEPAAPMLPIRIARGLMNLIWGGGTNDGEDDSDSESEDNEPTSNEGNHAVD